MSRTADKAGTKTGRREKNRLFQAALRARKRLRKQRREDQVENHGPIFMVGSQIVDARTATEINELAIGSARRLVPTPEQMFEKGVIVPASDRLQEQIDLHRNETLISNDSPNYPTEEQWAEVCAEAKSKKKGVEKMARNKGWELVYDGGDPKSRLDWEIPHA